MEDESNAAERAAKLRAAERAAEQERAENKARKKDSRKKKARARNEAFLYGLSNFGEFLSDYKFEILSVIFILIDIALCVLMCLGIAYMGPLYDRIAIICFYIGIGAAVLSAIVAIAYANYDDLNFLNLVLIFFTVALVVIGAIVLFVLIT